MISFSVIIPVTSDKAALRRTLAALSPDASRGYEVFLADAGQADGLTALADRMYARVVTTGMRRGRQKNEAAALAQHDWLLFLHPGTVLQPGWRQAVEAFLADAPIDQAAVFRFAIDSEESSARQTESLARMRMRWLGLSGGEQGLLIHHAFFNQLGGFALCDKAEDVELTRKIGRSRLTELDIEAVVEADAYQQEGYVMSVMRSTAMRYFLLLRVPAETVGNMLR